MRKSLFLIRRNVATWELKNYHNIHYIYRKCKKWYSVLALLSVAEATQCDVLFIYAKLKVWDTIPKINVTCSNNKFSQ